MIKLMEIERSNCEKTYEKGEKVLYYGLNKMIRHKIAIPTSADYYRRLEKDHITGWKRLIDTSVSFECLKNRSRTLEILSKPVMYFT